MSDEAPPINKILASAHRKNYVRNKAALFATPTGRDREITAAQTWVTEGLKEIEKQLKKDRETLAKGDATEGIDAMDYNTVGDLLDLKAHKLAKFVEESTKYLFPYDADSYLTAKGIKEHHKNGHHENEHHKKSDE